MRAGDMEHISFSVTPSAAKNRVTPVWRYDEEYLQIQTTSSGAILTAAKEGQTSVIIEAGGLSASCIVKIEGHSETYLDTLDPYIYSGTSVVQLTPGGTERFFVSLYGGTASDIDGYTWTIDNPATAAISPTGQYCQVKALQEGYARIKVTHARAPHPYYIGLYVLGDDSKPTYITTDNNILTLYKDKGDKAVSVDLKNPAGDDYRRSFTWEAADGGEHISLTGNGDNAVITPVSAGTATVRVSHPDATGGYPLDIIVRVVEIVENVYIEPSETVVTLTGQAQKSLTCKLAGLTEGSDYSVDDFTFEVEDGTILSHHAHGNEVVMQGLLNGSTSLHISHPKSARRRQVLVIVEGQTAGAVDASCYITTSQNYIKTKVGADDTTLNILLRGGEAGDEGGFRWTVSHAPGDGTSDVIAVTTPNGEVARSRAAALTYAAGTAHIEPLAEGTATITLTHPKVHYPTEVLVKVLPATAVLDTPVYFTGGGLVRLLNGNSTEYTVGMAGGTADENKTQWTADRSDIGVSAAGKTAVITSSASGQTTSHITITHPNAEHPKKVLVLTADTEEELSSMRAFYSDKLYHSVNVGDSTNLFVTAVGFSTYDEETGEETAADFSTLAWTSSSPSVAVVERGADALTGRVTGVSAGTATITAAYNGTSVSFAVTVYPEGVEIGQAESTAYLTTGNNVIAMRTPGTAAASVTAVGLPGSAAQSIEWTSADTTVATVIPNGESAEITGLREGETTIAVSHPESENSLTIYVRVGSEYVTASEPVVYISASAETITMTRDSAAARLDAVLVNGEAQDAGFSFAIDDTGIARIQAQYATGSCFVKPVSAGIAELTVSHPDAAADKRILVVVGNTEEELAGFKYLTTGSNVTTVPEGGTRTVSVSVKNADGILLDGYTWTTEDASVAGISATSASTAVITGNGPGTTRITVSHAECQKPLDIIVQCVDPVAASANPYVQAAQSVVTLTISSAWTTVTAELVGGTADDNASLQWESSDTSVLQVLGQNGTGKIRAVGAGTAYVSVSHAKAPYPAQILAICDEAEESGCSISAGESIIQMKPTSGARTVTASLVGGDATDADKHNFRWSLDVYDVVDLDHTANTAVITPKRQGQATLTISHPKSAYDQQVIIKVSEHDEFGFGSTHKSMTEGKTAFVSMRIPATSVKTHVEYSSSSPLVASAQGTSAVCQLTALSAGTSTITARLVATATNIVQAEAEMLVAVEEGSSNLVYITSAGTIYTLENGSNRTLSATLTGAGVLPTDQHNLQWRSADPGIVSISGTSTTGVAAGQSVYVTALSAGETTVTVSHEKSSSTLDLYIIVPGSEELSVALNKSYVTIEKGGSTEIKAEIDGGDTDDYSSITWTADKVDGVEVVRLMGSGRTVSCYGLAAGTATVTAQLPNGRSARCDVEVQDPKEFRFATTTVRVQPGKTKEVAYTVSPAAAGLQWVQNEDTYAMYSDLGNDAGSGSVLITGIKEGTSTLTCVTSYGSKATLQVVCAWDYSFSLSKTAVTGTPDASQTVTVRMHPADSELRIDGTETAHISAENHGDGTATLTITPLTEARNELVTVTAVNPATGEQYASKTLRLSFYHDRLTLVPSVISRSGSFSRYDAATGILVLGDGEQVELGFGVAEENADWTIAGVELVKKTAGSTSTVTQGDIVSAHGDSSWIVHARPDIVEQQYRIVTGYSPVYKDWSIALCSSSCTTAHEVGYHRTLQSSYDLPLSDFYWDGNTDFDSRIGEDYNWDTWGLLSKTHSRRSLDGSSANNGTMDVYDNTKWVEWWNDSNGKYAASHRHGGFFGRTRDESLDGKILTQSEFEATAWYYCPGVTEFGEGGTVSVDPHAMTCNIDAVKEDCTDTTVLSRVFTDIIKVEIHHNGATEFAEIPVYTETRGCPYDYTAD